MLTSVGADRGSPMLILELGNVVALDVDFDIVSLRMLARACFNTFNQPGMFGGISGKEMRLNGIYHLDFVLLPKLNFLEPTLTDENDYII